MNAQMTEDEKTEKIGEYGMMVSALHDSRYFNAKNAYEGEATPYNCPEDIKKILVERYGDKWKDGFWGIDYDNLFPTVKVLHEQRVGINPVEEVCESGCCQQRLVRFRAFWRSVKEWFICGHDLSWPGFPWEEKPRMMKYKYCWNKKCKMYLKRLTNNNPHGCELITPKLLNEVMIENLWYETQILKDRIAEHLRELQGCKDELRQKQRDLTLLRKKKMSMTATLKG